MRRPNPRSGRCGTASTTLSTVGYGDILPTRDETRMVTTLVLLLAFTFILREFNLLTEVPARLPSHAGLRRERANKGSGFQPNR
jgi:hypothetical protein